MTDTDELDRRLRSLTAERLRTEVRAPEGACLMGPTAVWLRHNELARAAEADAVIDYQERRNAKAAAERQRYHDTHTETA